MRRNIDGCIFMDLVAERSERVFIQCMGRVLRKDKLNKKKYGLIKNANIYDFLSSIKKRFPKRCRYYAITFRNSPRYHC